MSHNEREREPLYVWAPPLVLKFLVLGIVAFLLFEAMIGLGERDLPTNRVWVVVVGVAGLLLLLAIDRLTELRVSPGGVEAKLSETKAQALEEIGSLEDPTVAKVARKQILDARNAEQIETARAMAVDLNVNRVVEQVRQAIQGKRKCYARYRPEPEAPVKTYYIAPLDIRPGVTEGARQNDYLWAHSYEHDKTVSLRLDRIRGVELSKETFDPAVLMETWDEEKPAWNVPRAW